MASGQQIAKGNVQKFRNWVASKSDNDFRDLVNSKWQQLHRDRIAKECGFAKTALRQNPQIKSLLLELEDDLRTKGILPELVSKSKTKKFGPDEYLQSRTNKEEDSKRISKLEDENLMLKARIKTLEDKLMKFTELSDIMTELGVLPK